MKEPAAHAVGVAPSAPQSAALSRRWIFLGLACYFGLQVLFRLLVSDSAELDESEQLVLTQSWAWGYRSDPPLYIWLQRLIFGIFGLNIFSLSVLKNLLLLGTCFFAYRSAREMAEEETALLGTLSLLLLPQILWESQRDLTHTVLATTVAAATLWAGLRVWKEPKLWRFVVLGFCAGLGILSKYNYGLFLGAFLGAALSLKEMRASFLHRGLLVSAAICLALAGPHLSWLIHHSGPALNRFHQMQVDSGASAWGGYWHAFKSLCVALVSFVALLAAAYGAAVAFRRRTGERDPAASYYGEPSVGPKLLRRILVIELVCMVGMLLVFQTRFKDRWLQPLLFFAPIMAAFWSNGRLEWVQRRKLAQGIAILAAGALLVLPAIPMAAYISKRPTRLNAPFSALTHQLKAAGIQPGVIAAESRLTGGNLRLFFTASTVLAPEYPELRLTTGVGWLVAWDATRRAEPPAELSALVAWRRGVSLAEFQPQFVEAPYKYTGGKGMRLGYVLLPAQP